MALGKTVQAYCLTGLVSPFELAVSSLCERHIPYGVGHAGYTVAPSSLS